MSKCNLINRGILSTYKELCSLVTDLNRPKLLYKFIQLANYNKKKVIIIYFYIKDNNSYLENNSYLLNIIT